MCSISNVQLFYYWITDTSQNIKFFNRGEKFPLSGPRRPWCSSFRFFENNSIFTTVHLPFHISYFSNSSQNIIYRTLSFVMSFFSKLFREAAHRAYLCELQARSLTTKTQKNLFLSRQNQLSVGSVSKCFLMKLVNPLVSLSITQKTPTS